MNEGSREKVKDLHRKNKNILITSHMIPQLFFNAAADSLFSNSTTGYSAYLQLHFSLLQILFFFFIWWKKLGWNCFYDKSLLFFFSSLCHTSSLETFINVNRIFSDINQLLFMRGENIKFQLIINHKTFLIFLDFTLPLAQTTQNKAII